MSKPAQPYVRLTPTRRLPGGYASLWKAEDHLLHVSSSGYSESYRRYYYKDIQAFMVTDANTRLYWGLFLGGLWLLVGLIAFLASESYLAFLYPGLAFVPLLVWNQLLGEGCKVHVITKVQNSRIEAIGRRRQAHKVLGELRELLEKAQAVSEATRTGAGPETQPGEAGREQPVNGGGNA